MLPVPQPAQIIVVRGQIRPRVGQQNVLAGTPIETGAIAMPRIAHVARRSAGQANIGNQSISVGHKVVGASIVRNVAQIIAVKVKVFAPVGNRHLNASVDVSVLRNRPKERSARTNVAKGSVSVRCRQPGQQQ